MNDVILKYKILHMMILEAISGWKETINEIGLDAYICCNGRECCCGGMTNREFWESEIKTYKAKNETR